MYTYEIIQYLQNRHFNISNREYIDMVNNSEQIDHVRYNPYGDSYEIWTTDGYYANFTVHGGN